MWVRSRKVEVVEANPAWPELFRQERLRIVRRLGKHALAVEHIGSTAVPGLAAKPTIDIMVGLRRLSDAVECIPRLSAIGYIYLPRFELTMPFRRFFYRELGGRHTHHVHMVECDHPFWTRHIVFRDFLRSHPAIARDYGWLKQRLARRYRYDFAAYGNAKTPFILAVEARAQRAGGPQTGFAVQTTAPLPADLPARG